MFISLLKKFLTTELLEVKISIFDKMALWFRFLPNNQLKETINEGIINSKLIGKLEWIPVVGRCSDVSINICLR
jgi:hypothetical protein